MVDTVPFFEKNDVFIEQFVQTVPGFSSQYGSDISISYTAYNVAGKPSKFPEYGDFPQAFVMRTYGKWWNECPSKAITIMPQSVPKFDSQDFIDLEFEDYVYPTRVKVYETYNPGAVIRIWAASCYAKWALLWEGEPVNHPHAPRVFTPKLRMINFPTKYIRVEFHHLHLDYYTQLDAVLMRGTNENPYSQHNAQIPPTGMLSSQIFEMNIHNIPPQVNISNTITNFLGNDLPKYLTQADGTITQRLSPTQMAVTFGKSFNSLPNEIILHIFGYLDLISLCRCAQVSRHFNDLATDSLLYTELNFKYYWHCTTPSTLNSLAKRCQFLQKLDLSWCGSLRVLRPYHFENFIAHCGRSLTHLKLTSCKFVDNNCISAIARHSPDLRELYLENCRNITNVGFITLTHLVCLEYLNFYRSTIDLGSLQMILKATPRLKHINLGSCTQISNMDEVAVTLGSYNHRLISVDFWKTCSLTPAGVRALSQCHDLEEVDLGWCLGFGAPGDSLHALARGCPRLKKLFFAALRGVTDRDLEPFIELCPLLEQIDLLGVRCITSDLCEKFLKSCHNLALLDISFCDQILDSKVAVWMHQYPKVSIKRSFQRSVEVEFEDILML